jgi:Protein of unknown function (DUF2924)
MTGSDILASLEISRLEDLRSEWRRRFGAPPSLRSAELLRHVMAWRIQSSESGGFDTRTRRLLRSGANSREALLATGTIIAREYHGIRHEVEVTEGGYFHDGRAWNSLSEIARAITGTRWNGPRFFGLRPLP